MKVKELMTERVEFCHPDTDLGAAAMIMWRNDCGVVPVTDPETTRLVGILTDRDICMALATSGRRPVERRTREVMSRSPVTVRPNDDVREALDAMAGSQVRRLPVVNDDRKLLGVLSLNDVILHAQKSTSRAKGEFSADDLLRTLQAICQHRREVVRHAEPVPVGAA